MCHRNDNRFLDCQPRSAPGGRVLCQLGVSRPTPPEASRFPASVKSTDARKHLQFETSVAPTEATKELSPKRAGHIDRCTHELADIPLILPDSAPIVRPRLKNSSEERRAFDP